MKKVLLIVLVVAMSTLFVGCRSLDWNYYPTNQSGNTKWISLDNKMEIYVVNGDFYGYMTLEQEKIKIQGFVDEGGRFIIFAYSDYRLPNNFCELSESVQDSYIAEYDEKNRIEYESGQGHYHKNNFTVTFDKTTYLEPGEKITFHKVESTNLPADFTINTEVE